MKREQMIPRLRDRPNSKPVKQFQQPPRKAFAHSDSESDDMDAYEVPLPSKSQRRLDTEDNKNQLLKLRLAEPFPAHDSDELEEPVSDSKQSPVVFNSSKQETAEQKALFSPKFGGAPLES